MFQDEVRFALNIVPTIKNPITKQLETLKAIQLGFEVPIKYYDLKIDNTGFSNMVITTGPHCSTSDIIIVESLIKTLNPTSKLHYSKLHGKLRKK